MTPSIPEDQQEKQVDVPDEAIDLFMDRMPADLFLTYGQTEAALQAAAPAIRAQERERLECCETCEDTGVYTEGMEWAPCGGCFRGKEFLTLLKAHAKEVRQAERETVWGQLAPLLDQFKEVLNEHSKGKAGSGAALSRLEGEIEAVAKGGADV